MDGISTDGPGIVVQVVLTVRPENQQAVLDAIRTAGDPAEVPGLRGIHQLRSLDGTQVVNHMHWTDEAAFEARAQLPAIARIRARVQRLVEDASTNIYEVVS